EAFVELSVLSKPVKTVLSSVKKGDGLIVSKGLKSALFLPQVWSELPKKSEFIRELFLKAGLKLGETGVSYSKFTVAAYKKRFAMC
ncbi:MAG TPA: AMMECR1 domain-containing protein, partial [Candidatus Nanoarchaeia archaeon]|nr:AMMECR1 domain-containing protein [Candidatus Nanoarchaeia archaeon]